MLYAGWMLKAPHGISSDISQSYNAIVGPMMTISVRNSESPALLCMGRIICSRIKVGYNTNFNYIPF